MNEHYPFKLKPLPYAYDALEPYIDRETLHYHHDKHLQTYVDNLNDALKNHPQYHTTPLYILLKNVCYMPYDLQTKITNYGGGVFNHNLYFDTMKPPVENNMPQNEIKKAIERDFGSFSNFKKILTKTAVDVFGSGYGWLVKSDDGYLKILPTPNQNTPIMPCQKPILPVDVWEHAYYLQYKNLRKDYVENWFKLINWEAVNLLYNQ